MVVALPIAPVPMETQAQAVEGLAVVPAGLENPATPECLWCLRLLCHLEQL